MPRVRAQARSVLGLLSVCPSPARVTEDPGYVLAEMMRQQIPSTDFSCTMHDLSVRFCHR
jgi:hypothetical protein